MAGEETMAIFYGIALTALVGLFIWVYVKLISDSEYKGKIETEICDLKRILLRRVTKKQGIELDKEIMKMEMINGDRFRRRLDKEIEQELFGKDKKEDKE